VDWPLVLAANVSNLRNLAVQFECYGLQFLSMERHYSQLIMDYLFPTSHLTSTDYNKQVLNRYKTVRKSIIAGYYLRLIATNDLQS